MAPSGPKHLDEDINLDYSLAMDYEGPPLSYDLPRIDPVEVYYHHIPTVAVADMVTQSELSLIRTDIPVIEPVHFHHAQVSASLGHPYETPSISGSSNSAASTQDNQDVSPDICFDSSGSASGASPGPFQAAPRRGNRPTVVATDTKLSQRQDIESLDNLEYEGLFGKGNVKRRFRSVCFRCGRGKWKSKECCLVCSATYCSDCVLRAMGSMPEGRKCITCIGKPVEESKRSNLGKPSRILRHLLSPLEVDQILKAERECNANRLLPEQLIVNGKPLKLEEMRELLSCPLPPAKLRPGRYWYDKVLGLWGKEGKKPHQSITPNLKFSGKLLANASNGDTRVFINGREITKVELRILKLAKVQCPRGTRFWVYDDGRYEEEGQNNIKGNIWEKASIRFLSSLVSLPVPPAKTDHHPLNDKNSYGELSAFSGHMEHNRIGKLILLGIRGSGTSTIFKQAKFLYGKAFTDVELQNIKLLIQSNVYKYLSILLEGRERFEEDALSSLNEQGPFQESVAPGNDEDANGRCESNHCIYSIGPRLRTFSQWLLDTISAGELDSFFPAAAREHAPIVNELWRHNAIQATYRRKNELGCLPDVADYFLNKAIEVSSHGYDPSEKDILYAEGVTPGNGLTFTEFTLQDRSPLSEFYADDCYAPPPPPPRFQLIRLDAETVCEGCKRLEMFDDINAVVFCVALSDYDQMGISGNGIGMKNRMVQSKELFEATISCSSFRNIPFILILNKYDLFEEKISTVPLSVCEWFNDFCSVRPQHNNKAIAHQAYHYIAVKFKGLFASVTGRKLFVWQTQARDKLAVDEVFKYVREVLKWDHEKNESYCGYDDPFYSTDTSSPPFTRREP